VLRLRVRGKPGAVYKRTFSGEVLLQRLVGYIMKVVRWLFVRWVFVLPVANAPVWLVVRRQTARTGGIENKCFTINTKRHIIIIDSVIGFCNCWVSTLKQRIELKIPTLWCS
jgi:hypothetical protein